MAIQLVLGTAIPELLKMIGQERETNIRLESILTTLKATLDSAFPNICVMGELRESNGLPKDELRSLLQQLNEASETVDECSRVAWWNYCKKRKYFKDLSKFNASLQNFFLVNLPIDQYQNTTWIQVQLIEIGRRLDRVAITNKRNGSRRMFDRSRYKVWDAATELKKIIQSLPGWFFLYLRSFMRIPLWGYPRITNMTNK